ncbi:hypothetical protein [Flavobacterium limnophilum]|uniref:hypothetical protein n=1 Tax=Flavobacterium limnophilum TaxID=3003262 RepID=UPI002482F320|nr:hypothetical protein [Flavobacterium limnophilum]
MDKIFKTYKKLFTQRCHNIPLLEIGEDSVRYDFFIASTEVKNLKNYEIVLESAISSQAYIPRQVSPNTLRKQKPKMDIVIDKLNICAEFGLFRQNSNEEGTINKTNRLIKTLNDMIRLGLESNFTKRNAYFICVADSKMLRHQLQSKSLGPFPSDYQINLDLVNELCLKKTSDFDRRFINKMQELNLSFNAKLIFNEEIIADKINLETRLIAWEVVRA